MVVGIFTPVLATGVQCRCPSLHRQEDRKQVVPVRSTTQQACSTVPPPTPAVSPTIQAEVVIFLWEEACQRNGSVQVGR